MPLLKAGMYWAEEPLSGLCIACACATAGARQLSGDLHANRLLRRSLSARQEHEDMSTPHMITP